MKTALLHYWLTNMRGGEKVLAALGEMLPEADIFTHALGMGMREKGEVRQMENRFLEGLSQEDCDKAARLISTMFRGVHNTPKKSVRTDHRIQYSA